VNFREFPIEVEAEDFLYAAKGYDAAAVKEDRNVHIPIDRLLEYEANGVIGRLNNVWWSLSPWIPNAALVASELAPQIAERLVNYEIKAALLIPASRLCHQTLGIVARAIEQRGIPTMLISVDRLTTDKVRPPRTAYYTGEFGAVAVISGKLRGKASRRGARATQLTIDEVTFTWEHRHTFVIDGKLLHAYAF
jgi:hypothetical protein